MIFIHFCEIVFRSIIWFAFQKTLEVHFSLFESWGDFFIGDEWLMRMEKVGLSEKERIKN